MRVINPFDSPSRADACLLLHLRGGSTPYLDAEDVVPREVRRWEAEAGTVVVTASEATGHSPPPFHIPISERAARAARRFFGPCPPPSVLGMYHGTSGKVADRLADGEPLAASRLSTKPMLGAACYVGDYLKATRFAQYDADWNVRRDGALVRYLVHVPDPARVARAPFRSPCSCGCPARTAAYVDHHAHWRDGADIALIPAECAWAPGKFVSRHCELAVRPSRLRAVGSARVDLGTAHVPRDPTFRGHSVVFKTISCCAGRCGQ